MQTVLQTYVNNGSFDTRHSSRKVAEEVSAENRIQELCSNAIAAQDQDELERILTELRSAIRQQVRLTRDIAVLTMQRLPSKFDDIEKKAG